MSALAVALSFKGQPDPVTLTAILLDAQSDRGPDETSRWSDAGVSLAVAHLFRSPKHRVQDHRVHTAVENCVVAWDGRLDNRAELLAALDLPADALIADAPLVVRGWRAWGRTLPERLRGDFAFVLWDLRERVVFAARDPLGARPFYYVSRSDYFAVASDDEALIRLPGVSADWHPDRLFYRDHPGFWAFDWQNAWRRDVLILMPGHALEVSRDGRLRRWRWHDWGPPPEPFRGDLRDAADAFGEALCQSARDRLRDIDAIGVIASGGIDSLSVLSAASEECSGRSIHQFSVLHDDGEAEIETRAIMRAAEAFGLERHWVHLPSRTGAATQADFDAIHAIRHPVDDTIPLIALLCRVARRDGVPYLLHGASGDCVLWASEHAIVDPLLEDGRVTLGRCWREAVAASAHHTYLNGLTPLGIVGRALLWRLTPPILRDLWRMRHRLQFPDPDPVRGTSYTRRHRRRVLAEERRAWRSRDAEYLDQLHPIGVLRGVEGYQRVAGRWGIELADPLADRRVIDLARRFGARLRTAAGWTKAPARYWVAREGALHASAFRSDKTHLGELFLR